MVLFLSGSSGVVVWNICFYCNKFGYWVNKCLEKGNGSFINIVLVIVLGSK